MSALVRITTGIMAQHSRVGMTRAMTQFGEVIHCHKPPYSGIPGEDFVNVRFGTQTAADAAYAALKACQVFVDGFQVGVGPAPAARGVEALAADNRGGGNYGGGGGGRRRSMSPPRRYGRNVAGYRDQNNSRRSPERGSRQNYSPPRRDRDRDRRPRSPENPGANFPSRNDPKSPSPRRMAREMAMGGGRTRPRSRSNHRAPTREERPRGSQNEFSAPAPGMMSMMRVTDGARARTPSPDPPGPMKNTTLVKNPFYNQYYTESPTGPEADDQYGGRALLA